MRELRNAFYIFTTFKTPRAPLSSPQSHTLVRPNTNLALFALVTTGPQPTMNDDKKFATGESHSPEGLSDIEAPPLEDTSKSRWQRLQPAFACGAGLFSDGYLQAVIGPVNKILDELYPKKYAASSATQNVSSIAFAGTVVGQLVFGYTSDHYSRKWSLLVSTVILFVFAALGAGSYGAGGSTEGLFAALTAYRFLLGIGIG